MTHLQTKKSEIGAREVVQCSNNNCFLSLDIDIAISGCPIGCYTAENAPYIAINKINKTPCNQMPKVATEQVCYLPSAILAPAEC